MRGFEVRIIFFEGDELAHRAREGAFRAAAGLRVIPCRKRRIAFFNNVREQLFFMRCVGFYRRNNLRNKVGAAFKLHSNIRPPIVTHKTFSHEAVINNDDGRNNHDA